MIIKILIVSWVVSLVIFLTTLSLNLLFDIDGDFATRLFLFSGIYCMVVIMSPVIVSLIIIAWMA